jgi:catalase
MPNSKRSVPPEPKRAKPKSAAAKKVGATSKAAARNTASGPAHPIESIDALAKKAAGTQALVEAIPYNANKPLEIGRDNALRPPEGACVPPSSPDVTGSTLTERNASVKAGSGAGGTEFEALKGQQPSQSGNGMLLNRARTLPGETCRLPVGWHGFRSPEAGWDKCVEATLRGVAFLF